MTDDKNTQSDDGDAQDRDLKATVKAYVLAAYVWLRDALGQSIEEIAPQLRGSLSGVSIPARAWKPLALAGVLLIAAVAMPAMPMNDGTSDVETTEEPVVGTTYDAPADGEYRRIVESALGTAEPDAPDAPSEVRTSAGSQTMSVQTSVVDGEPAIVLDDDRTHDGRWVSIETSWFEENVGEVPSAAFISHESGDEYAAPLQVRGDSAAFYVKEFSTNTVTFSGEVRLTGAQAADGTQYQYELANTSGINDPSINLTGVTNSAWNNRTGTAQGGSVDTFEIGGTTTPTGPGGNPQLTVSLPDAVSNPGSSYTDNNRYALADAGVETKIRVDNPPESFNQIRIHWEDAYADKNAEIYVTEGWDPNENHPFTKGTKLGDITVSTADGDKKITYDLSSYSPSSDQITIVLVSNSDGDRVEIETDGSASGPWIANYRYSTTEYWNEYPNVELPPQPTSPEVTIDGTTTQFGTISSGGSSTEPVNLTPGSVDFDWVGGNFNYNLEVKEISETVDPVVELNGNTVSHSGTLADGQTVFLSQNASALQEGTNRVNISTNSPTSGPASLVGFEYSHGAETTTSATVDETTWSQSTNVSKTWAGDRANATATIPMNDRVVSVRDVEMRINGTSWQTVAKSDYTLSGTDLTVQLGDVAAGSTTEVRATGSKVRVTDGAITVLDPTTSSATLNTRIQIENAGPDFALSVDETTFSNRVHYAENATWGATNGSTTISASGEQTFSLPDAVTGAEATVRTWPIEVAPVTGQVTVPERAGDRTEPGISVRGDGNSEVDYTFVDAADATPYVLYSTTNGIVRDEGLASSPITLTDDNSDETLVFRVDDGSASGSSSSAGSGPSATVGGVAPMEAASGGYTALQALVPSGSTLLLGVALLGGLFVVGRRTGVVTEGRQQAATSAATSAAGTAGGLVERALDNQIVVGALILGGGAWVLSSGVLSDQATLIVSLAAVPVAMFLVLQQFDRFDVRIWAGSTALVGVLGIQALAPTLAERFVEETGVILAVGALILGWRALSAWRAEANTPDNVTRLQIDAEEDDDA